MLAILHSKQGATIATISGWQPHSVRGTAVVRKKLGLTLVSEKTGELGGDPVLPNLGHCARRLDGRPTTGLGYEGGELVFAAGLVLVAGGHFYTNVWRNLV